jgi:hypothetical protein
MRRLLPVVVSSLLLGAMAAMACSRTQGVTLVVDSAHSQVGQPDGKEGLKYVLAPTTAVTLDARQFDFSHSLYPNTRPSAVQLVIGNQRQYSAPWKPSGLVELSQKTLSRVNDSPPFAGLTPGDKAIVAIGEQRLDAMKQEIVLKVLWVGLIEVKE